MHQLQISQKNYTTPTYPRKEYLNLFNKTISRMNLIRLIISSKFSIVSFQKIYIISILQSKFIIIIQEKLIILLLDFRRFCSFINCQIPRVLALFASVYKPDINPIAIGIHSELSRINKFLLFPASPTAMVYFYRIQTH